VLFDKICRENGITHRLTKIHSPPLTGQSLDHPVVDAAGRDRGAGLAAWVSGAGVSP